MKNAAWFKCYPRDFLEGIEGLDAEEASIYVVAIFRIYAVGGPIPYSPQTLGGLVKIKTRKANEIVLKLLGLEKLILTPDGDLYNKKAAEVQNQKLLLSETRRAVGQLGGRPRKSAASGSVSTSGSGAASGATTPTYRPTSREELDIEPDTVAGAKTAENGQSGKPNALASEKQTHNLNGSYVRVCARASESEPEEEISQSSIPLPRDEEDGDFEGERGGENAAEIARLTAEISLPHNRQRLEDAVDIPGLTKRIMQRAAMVVPPFDLVLVSAWINLGFDPELDVMAVVDRLCGHAKSPPCAMRYFDAEIRRYAAARMASGDTQMDEFDRIIARSKVASGD